MERGEDGRGEDGKRIEREKGREDGEEKKIKKKLQKRWTHDMFINSPAIEKRHQIFFDDFSANDAKITISSDIVPLVYR